MISHDIANIEMQAPLKAPTQNEKVSIIPSLHAVGVGEVAGLGDGRG